MYVKYMNLQIIFYRAEFEKYCKKSIERVTIIRLYRVFYACLMVAIYGNSKLLYMCI